MATGEPTFGKPLPLRSDLRCFGYAPGSYSGICFHCHNQMHNVDKRASCCLSCAEKQKAANAAD